jgi:hypothetical protein
MCGSAHLFAVAIEGFEIAPLQMLDLGPKSEAGESS